MKNLTKVKVEYQQYEDGTHVCVAYKNGDWFCDCGKAGEIETEKNAKLIVRLINKNLKATT